MCLWILPLKVLTSLKRCLFKKKISVIIGYYCLKGNDKRSCSRWWFLICVFFFPVLGHTLVYKHQGTLVYSSEIARICGGFVMIGQPAVHWLIWHLPLKFLTVEFTWINFLLLFPDVAASKAPFAGCFCRLPQGGSVLRKVRQGWMSALPHGERMLMWVCSSGRTRCKVILSHDGEDITASSRHLIYI